MCKTCLLYFAVDGGRSTSEHGWSIDVWRSLPLVKVCGCVCFCCSLCTRCNRSVAVDQSWYARSHRAERPFGSQGCGRSLGSCHRGCSSSQVKEIRINWFSLLGGISVACAGHNQHGGQRNRGPETAGLMRRCTVTESLRVCVCLDSLALGACSSTVVIGTSDALGCSSLGARCTLGPTPEQEKNRKEREAMYFGDSFLQLVVVPKKRRLADSVSGFTKLKRPGSPQWPRGPANSTAITDWTQLFRIHRRPDWWQKAS